MYEFEATFGFQNVYKENLQPELEAWDRSIHGEELRCLTYF